MGWLPGFVYSYVCVINDLLLGTPPPLRSSGIMELGGKFRQVFGFKGVTGKVFRNKELRDLNTENVLLSSFIAPTLVPRFTSPPPPESARQNEGRSRWPRPDCFARVVRKFRSRLGGVKFVFYSILLLHRSAGCAVMALTHHL